MKGITLKKMLISIILIIKHHHLALIMHILQTSSIMLMCLRRSIELKWWCLMPGCIICENAKVWNCESDNT